ncbi:M3 family oligoendopeptidase [Candidatus Liberibacter brunswickensis]|uniref:M3 family oligoendopeptidase n=1 Tax=Candidatus Liberibacter brunswickensis TaxID=1968796 RepID=UPI002FE35C66
MSQKYFNYANFTNLFSSRILFNANTKISSKQNIGNLPRWNLKDLYPSIDSKEILRDLELIKNESLAFKTRWKDNLKNATSNKRCNGLGAAIAEYEKIIELTERIYSYAFLLYSCGLSDDKIRRFYQNIEEKISEFKKTVMFFKLEINRLDDDILKKCYSQDSLALKYSSWIRITRKTKKHSLSNELECLFSDTDQIGKKALTRFFSETFDSLRFKVNNKEMTVSEAYPLILHHNRRVRQSSTQAMSDTFKKSSNIFSFIINTLIHNEQIQDNWRKYEKISDSCHLANDVEPSIIESLVKTVKSNYQNTSHRYFSLKKKWLKLDHMYFWDRVAPPIPGTPKDIFSFEEAKDIVLKAYHDFSPQMSKIAEKFFTNHWIDAAQYHGKQSGSFAHPTIPSVHPYILLNFTGKRLDITTLAHELGHGIHQVLSSESQEMLMSTPSLTLSETASIFGETLAFDYLIKSTSNKKERKILIANKIEDSMNSIIRQISFYDFELKLHKERRSKGNIPDHRINQIWIETQKESLGPAFDLDEDYGYFWMMIPHFFASPFYVYSYAFGNCLVNSLYDIYKSNSISNFQEKYINILRAGNSKHYSELLLPLNINLADPNFWERGLTSVEKMIDEVENM